MYENLSSVTETDTTGRDEPHSAMYSTPLSPSRPLRVESPEARSPRWEARPLTPPQPHTRGPRGRLGGAAEETEDPLRGVQHGAAARTRRPAVRPACDLQATAHHH